MNDNTGDIALRTSPVPVLKPNDGALSPSNGPRYEHIPAPTPPATEQKKELWKDIIAPMFCCFSKKSEYEEIKPETAEEMTQRIQELYTLFDRVNEQLQTVQASSEMQRILQERLVEQVHEMDDQISNNKSETITELQELADQEVENRKELRETILDYIEGERLKDIEDVLTGHSNNSSQIVEQVLTLKSQLSDLEETCYHNANITQQHSDAMEKVDARLCTCENRAGIGEDEKLMLIDEVKRNSAFTQEREDATLQRITTLEQTNTLLLAKYETGEDGQKKVDAAFITRLADNDRETAGVKSKIQVMERKVDDLVTKGYVDNVIKALQDERNQFITKSVERTAAFHMEQSKKELAQKQANRIGEIEGKLEGLRVLVTGLVKSVETRDAELTQMNKSYFDELQRHVDDTSEELRRTFAEFKVIKRNFEEQHRRMSTMERTVDKMGDVTTIEDDIHILAKKLDRLENRVEHVVDKVVELGERSPSPELDDLARLKRDLRKGNKPLTGGRSRHSSAAGPGGVSSGHVSGEEIGYESAGSQPEEPATPPVSNRRSRQLSGLGPKSSLSTRRMGAYNE